MFGGKGCAPSVFPLLKVVFLIIKAEIKTKEVDNSADGSFYFQRDVSPA